MKRLSNKNNKGNNIQDLKKDADRKGPEMSANIAKVTKIFLAS